MLTRPTLKLWWGSLVEAFLLLLLDVIRCDISGLFIEYTYPGEPKEFVREAEVLRFLRAHLYGVSCVRAVSPGRSRRR